MCTNSTILITLFLCDTYSDYQTSLTSLSARWTVEGDACPAVRYEWAIERVDGHRVFDFYDTNGKFIQS